MERFHGTAQRANCRTNAISCRAEPFTNTIGNDTRAVSSTARCILYGTADGVDIDTELLCALNDGSRSTQDLGRKGYRIFYAFKIYSHPTIPFAIPLSGSVTTFKKQQALGTASHIYTECLKPLSKQSNSCSVKRNSETSFNRRVQ